MKKFIKRIIHGVGEWAKRSLNIQIGCEYNCHYCYAKAGAIWRRYSTRQQWRNPIINLRKIRKGYRKVVGRTMFPTTHDITQRNIDHCITVLRKSLGAGNDILVVMKPHPSVVDRLLDALEPFKDLVTFRFTIGTMNDEVRALWEPNAPTIDERMRALMDAYIRGFRTSVSIEPMLDHQPWDVVEAVRPYVSDKIWIGTPRRLNWVLSMNCPENVEVRAAARILMEGFDLPFIQSLYDRYKADPVIRWKDSLKDILGLERPTEAGLDI